MSLDVDGRVLRFDSFSKVISGGMRLGWVTGPRELVDRIQLQEQATNLHASGLSQALLLTLVDHWGAERLHSHLDEVAKVYRKRRDLCLRLSEKYLTGLAEWRTPEAGRSTRVSRCPSCCVSCLLTVSSLLNALFFTPLFALLLLGMFLWYKIPGVEDTDALIMEKAVENKVLMVPGRGN
jgi:kynurenine/2-aminoadipate aminotransferase